MTADTYLSVANAREQKLVVGCDVGDEKEGREVD